MVEYNYHYKVEFTTQFELNDQTAQGTIEIDKDSQLLEYYNWTGDKNFIQPDGSIVIPITKDFYTVGGKQILYNLPIHMKEEKIGELLQKNMLLPMDVKIKFRNGKTGVTERKLKNVYLTNKGTVNSNTFNGIINSNGLDFEKIQLTYFDSYEHEYRLWGENSDKWASETKQMADNGRFNLEFELSKGLEWTGDSQNFNENTRQVSMTLDSSNFILDYDKSGGPYSLYMRFVNLPIRLPYNFNGLNEIPKQFDFKNYKLTYQVSDSRSIIIDGGENVSKAINIKNSNGVFSGVKKYGDTLNGQKDLELIKFRIGENSSAQQQNIRIPKFSFSIDFEKKLEAYQGKFSINDVFEIKRIQLQLPKDQNGKVIKMDVEVETSKETKNYSSLDSANSVISLEDGEVIKSFKAQPTDTSIVVKTEGSLTFHGDINIKDEDAFFNGKDTVDFSYGEALSEKTLTESPSSSFYEKVKDDPSTRIRNLVNISLSKSYSLNPIYPYATNISSTINFNVPEAIYNQKDVTYKLSDEFIKKDHLRINSISPYYNSRKIKLVYTTNLEPTEKTMESTNGVKLSDDEYFTSLSVTVTSNTEININMFNTYIPEKTTNESMNVFEVEAVGKIEHSFIKYQNIVFNSKVKVNYSSQLDYGGSLSSLNPNDSRTLPVKMNYSKSSTSNGISVGDKKIYNPIFYLQIPDNFDYEGIDLSGSMSGKKPRIVLLEQPSGIKVVKIEFYGNVDSDTGYYKEYQNGDLQLKVKVNEFAKPGSVSNAINKYVAVDLSADMERFMAQHENVSTSYASANVDIYDSESDQRKSLMNNYSYYNRLSYNILQNSSVISSAKVNSSTHVAQTDELAVRSGEKFNVFIDFYNNGGSPMQDFTMYIPVAQEGKSSNSGDAWQWSAKLVEAGLDTTGTVNVSYSTQENPTMNMLEGKPDKSGMYVGNVSDMSKVTMVKLSANNINNATLISLKAVVSDAIPKETLGDKEIKVQGYAAYRNVGSNKFVKADTNPVTVRLSDTVLKVILFVDKNENGVLDSDEERLRNKTLTLYDKDDKIIKTVPSDSKGEYEITVPSIKEGDYLKIDKLDGYILTWQNKAEQDKRSASYFNPDTYTALPTLADAEHLNAGFIEAPEIILEPDTYTIRMKKTDQITYTLSDKSTKNVRFESADEKIATVDETGVITPVSVGETTIKVYYETTSGLKVSSKAKVKVESNDAPVITAPETVTMNVNDLWDPLDISIIDGLALSDDHDKVDINDLIVVEDTVPVGDKFLFFFKTSSTDKIKKAGTYRVTYSYEDEDGNKTEKTVKVKVNGQPYLTDREEHKLDVDAMPDFFFRVGSSLDPFKDVKAFYEKAGDEIDDPVSVVEILKDDRTNGIFTLGQPVDNDGNPVAGSPSEAGKYTGTYYIKTASEAKSKAEVSIPRTLYAQGKIEFSGHNIIYPSSSGITKFKTWDEFYEKYKGKLNLTAKVSTPKKDGSLEEKDLLKTCNVIDPDTGKALDFSTIDFSLPEGETSRTITLTLRVTDDGKAQWDSSGPSVYGEEHKDIDIIITIQEHDGNAPHIHAEDIERVTTDEVRDVTTTTPDVNLISEKAIADAKANKKNPLYDRLINDVKFETGEAGATITEKELASIERSSMNAEGTSKVTYDPNEIDDLYEMFTTIGTYKLMYRTKDSNNNQIYKERMLYVTGPTVFVGSMSDKKKAEAVINLEESTKEYLPANLFAYHIDADEKTIHETSVLQDKNSLDIRSVGTYKVTYTTEHHYTTYPDGTTPRPADTWMVEVRVHGSIRFDLERNNILYTLNDNQKMNQFVDKSFNLKEIEAAFRYYNLPNNGVIKVPPVYNQASDTLTSSNAASIPVMFDADASSKSGVKDHKASLKLIYEFYGLPEIEAKDTVRVKADSTQDELKAAIAAKATIAMPDGSSKNLDISYDFANIDKDDSSVVLKTSYTVKTDIAIYGSVYTIYTETRTDEKTVKLEKVEKPTLEAEDIDYNVGDALDILKDSKVTGEYDKQPIDTKDIVVGGHIPVDQDGKVNTPATYKVTLSYEDKDTGNKTEKDILVKVNGLPEFHDLPDLEKRVGDDIDILQTAYVTWMKAPDHEGSATSESFNYANAIDNGAKFELRDTKNELTDEAVDFSALNQPGYYSGEYYAITPAGGKASERHTLLLHGKPVLDSSGTLNISKNVAKPDDFLAAYKDELGLKASVLRAYKDKEPATVDLSDRISVSDKELDTIRYGTPGSYPITITVTDTVDVPDSKSNTVSKTITVNIVEVNGTPPTITTPASVQRVVGDDIGINDAGKGNIAAYLLDKATYQEHDNKISETKLKSIRKVQGPSDNTFDKQDSPNQDLLMKLLNTVGEYEAVIEVIDEKANRVQAAMKIEVAGKTEFGYDKDGTFVELEKYVNVRQSDRKYSYDGLYARHMDPSGVYDKVGIFITEDKDISKVSKIPLYVSAIHHYPYYDDNPGYLRKSDTFDFNLLVQGKIEIKNTDDIYARVGTKVNAADGVTATFESIDKDGNIRTKNAAVQFIDRTFSSVGSYSLSITATDEITGAPDNAVSANRNAIIWSVPNISYNEQFNVSLDATANDLANGLQAKMTFRDENNQERHVSADMVDISYKETLEKIQKGGAGKRYPLTITVTYKDNGADKDIEKTAYVYVLNDPAAIVQIPKYLELTDAGKDQIEAEAAVSLYKEADKDEDKDSVPVISITVDPEITLSKGAESFKAYTYTKTDTKYDGTAPIMKLQYGNTESDTFSLKAAKADIDEKNIGVYKGTLNFLMEYGGK